MTNAAPLLLDACVAINLAATGRPLSEFAARDEPLWLGERAAQEAMYLEPAEPGGVREPISLQSAADAGRLVMLELGPGELDLFVDFARDLDDGEAEALAMTASRGAVLATDDRKARRIAAACNPPIAVMSTPAIMRRWASTEPVPSADELATALRAIERRASFVPPRDDPDRDWWTIGVGGA